MLSVVERFLSAGFVERLAMATNDPSAAVLREYFGADALEDYQRLAAEFDGGHLAGNEPTNLVFLPGVMGSSLNSAGLGGIWWLDILNRDRIRGLRLSANGISDHDPRARIEPVGVMGAYEGFLAATYASGDFVHQAVPYDWRKPLRDSAWQIHDAIVGTSNESGEPVHIVAHSMGGLLTRTTLMTYPELWNRIGRVIFIGTPNYGAPAIAGYLKNHLWGFESLALLGRYLDRSAFRSLRGVLNLLPAPADIYPGAAPDCHPCANFDIYDADAWQLALDSVEQAALQAALDDTAQLHRDLHSWHRSLDAEYRERMAIIAGVGQRTLFRLAYRSGFGWHWRHMDRITRREPGNAHREGDGRVPLASAALGDVEIRYVAAEHGRMPTVPAVYQDVFRFLRGHPMQLARSPEEALDSSHLADTGESITPILSSGGITPVGDDPGYLNMATVEEVTLDALDAAVSAGDFPAFTRVRIL
jgi:pimeloyl-ACP methyl ester carboxylesterase